MTAPKPVRVLAVTSGKGGVGKSSVSVNLAVSLAGAGNRVMLMDADLGLANIDVLLGLTPRYNLSHVIEGQVGLEEILLRGPEGISIVPAASGTKRMAELSPAENIGLINSFSDLSDDVDYLIVDTAAGIADSVISFSRAAHEVLVVVCDEPSSLTDAYALIKVLNRDYGVGRFHVVANMVSGPQQGRELYQKLVRVCDRYLDVRLEHVGSVPMCERLRAAVQKQRPVVSMYPGSPSAKAFADLGKTLHRLPAPSAAEGHLQFFVERMIRYSQNMVGS